MHKTLDINRRMDASLGGKELHYHEGKNLRFPAKQKGVAKAEGTLDVVVDQCQSHLGNAASTRDVQ